MSSQIRCQTHKSVGHMITTIFRVCFQEKRGKMSTSLQDSLFNFWWYVLGPGVETGKEKESYLIYRQWLSKTYRFYLLNITFYNVPFRYQEHWSSYYSSCPKTVSMWIFAFFFSLLPTSAFPNTIHSSAPYFPNVCTWM